MPPHIWTLSWFAPDTELLVGEEDFHLLSDSDVAQVLAVPADDVLGGEFPIDEIRANRFNIVTGHVFHLTLFHYFLGATDARRRHTLVSP